MLWINNVSPPGTPDNQPHDYIVRINNLPPLATFQHVRNLGAAECLRAAADAIEKTQREKMAEILRKQAERPIGIKPGKRPVVDTGGEG